MNRSYVTIREMLQQARQFHGQVRDLYVACAQGAGTRARPLLEYLAGQEEEAARALESYDREGDSDLLATWVQYGPEDVQLQPPRPDEVRADMAPAEIVEAAARFDAALAAFFGKAIAHDLTGPARELLARLEERQTAQQKRVRQVLAESDQMT